MSSASAQGHSTHNPLKLIGLIFTIAGLVIFTYAIFSGSFQIDADALAKAEAKVPAEHLEKLAPLNDRVFDSQFSALPAVEKTINADGKISDYNLQEYKFWLLTAAAKGPVNSNPWLFFLLTIGLTSLGGILYALPGFKSLPGIKHDNIYFNSSMNRGLVGILIGTYLIAFYVLLYWRHEYFVNAIALVEPLSQALRNMPADRWFLYGTLYTLAVTVMGVRMFTKYRHNRYHLIRTASVMFFQFAFAFAIPTIMERLNRPSMDFKNAWPLNYTFFMDWNLNNLLSSGNLGLFMLFWGIALTLIVVPVLAYFFGKRWYCSWVCGCGGLAETLGDPFRQLSDKSVKAWKAERYIIHGVLVFAVVMTFIQISNFLSNGSWFGNETWQVNKAYSFWIGGAFAGVVGTGFYPLMGNRVWCRFGCPLAAILGMIQKFQSRFVITTNGGQCISCGNCSTYCEMGIDVRWYAQRGQNIIRSSCVGCGVCAAVCPRGVLKLENTTPGERYNVVIDDEIMRMALEKTNTSTLQAN